MASRLLFLILLFCCSISFARIIPRFPSSITRPEQYFSFSTGNNNKLYETKYFTQLLDHFTFTPESYQTFQQRYLINHKHWGGSKKNSPIFVYTGNEGDIEWFAQNTGFMFDTAPHFEALLVFIEHRFYGKSIPFGGNKEVAYANSSTLGYLTSTQALADYATLIIDLKKNLTAEDSPVVVFGGSYGGMLAAWFRLKYPHVAIGALASSAPILNFENITSPYSFNNIITQDFRSESENCYQVIKKSWQQIEDTAKESGGLELLRNSFRVCKNYINADALEGWLGTAYTYSAMTDYPTPSNFLNPLPAYPVKQMCKEIDDPKKGNNTFEKLYAAANIYYNYTGKVKCFNLMEQPDPHGLAEWTWQVNQLIQEQRSDKNEINYLMKCFAEEKAAWKNKERQAVEAAIDTIAGELEVERKLRRRFESLNKKLGKELAETKTSFMKAVKELESEKRAREIVEQVCDELARDVGEDKVVVEELKRDAEKVREEVEKEREMLHLADMLREERVQMKLSEAKHQFEEKNTAVDKLRKQLEAFLGRKRGKEKRSGSHNFVTEEDISACLSKSQFSTHQSQEKEDPGEVEDVVDQEDDSAESELHSIELNLNNGNSRSYKWAHASNLGRESRRISVDDEIKGRNSITGQLPRKSSSLQRSISEGVEWGIQARSLQNAAEGLDGERITEMDKQAQRKSSADEAHRNKALKGLRDHLMSSSRTGSAREFMSPTRQWEQPWPLRDPCSIVQERSTVGSKSRLGEAREGQTARRSKW